MFDVDALAEETESEFLQIDGCQECIVGSVSPINEPTRLVYSYDRLIYHFIKDGMSIDEASDYVDFNIVGAYGGPGTPLILEHEEEGDELTQRAISLLYMVYVRALPKETRKEVVKFFENRFDD